MVDPKDVDAALDTVLGPSPSELVEERAEPKDPDDVNEALGHLYRSPANFYQRG